MGKRKVTILETAAIAEVAFLLKAKVCLLQQKNLLMMFLNTLKSYLTTLLNIDYALIKNRKGLDIAAPTINRNSL